MVLQFQSIVADTFVVDWSGGRWSELGEYKFPEANYMCSTYTCTV